MKRRSRALAGPMVEVKLDIRRMRQRVAADAKFTRPARGHPHLVAGRAWQRWPHTDRLCPGGD
jgi:hypothetical protein